MQNMIELAENELYYFDAKAAARAVNFIEKFCFHWEGEYAGQPFKLIPYQRKATRDLFGWKRRSDKRRRFSEMYCEIAKGNGKSPWLAAIGLYMLLADNEAGAHVVSAATDFSQANETFKFGRKMIQANKHLATLCEIKQFHIDAPRNGIWRIVSGTAEGKHGSRPTCLLTDEAHEWPNRKLYDNLTSNAGKRRNSLILVATNAGSDKNSICWELHERARKVLTGESREQGLYPMIFAAGQDDPPGDVATQRKANPAYDHIAALPANLEREWTKARGNPALEARYRRFNLSQWIQGADKWIDMAAWDACTAPVKARDVAELPLYVGLDMSLSDDLCAGTLVWVGKSKWYVKTRCYIPKVTAHKYEDRDGIRYTEWGEAGHIQLLESTTIDAAVKRRIAKYILKLSKKFQIQSVCYDRAKATEAITQLEREGITCIPVKQGFDLSPPCEELTRRLKDQTIIIDDNPLMRWCASNVEVATGGRNGDIRLIKPGAKGEYAGLRSAKIDPIVALVTAISQIRRQEIGADENPNKVWDGFVAFV